jgi:hypothetical protein
MATTPSWRVGAFAQRYPRAAMDIGRAHAMHARACGMLYDTAGTALESSFRNEPLTGACCGGADCCDGAQTVPSSCCAAGVCCGCGPGDDDVEAVYPAITVAVDEAHALEAAQRDILTDPDVEDVPAAMSQAVELASQGKLSAFYVPVSPAKKMPDGSDAPACCPICGCNPCPACGCCCECCDSAPKPAAEDDPMSM